MEWISVKDRLPEEKTKAYRILTIATKEYAEKSNYPNQGIMGVNQDWIVRNWPSNFTHWMPLPPSPSEQENQ